MTPYTRQELEQAHQAEPLHPRMCQLAIARSVVRLTGWGSLCVLMLVLFYMVGGVAQWYFFVPWSMLCIWTTWRHVVQIIEMRRRRELSRIFWERHPERAIQLIFEHNQTNMARRHEYLQHSSSKMSHVLRRVCVLAVLGVLGLLGFEALEQFELSYDVIMVIRRLHALLIVLVGAWHIKPVLAWQTSQRQLREVDRHLLSIRKVQHHLPQQVDGALSAVRSDKELGAISQIFE